MNQTGIHAMRRKCPTQTIYAACLAILLPLVCSTACQQAGGEAKGDAAPFQPKGEVWEAWYMQGAKVGYAKTVTREVTEKGRKLVAIDSLTHLEIVRQGQRNRQEISAGTTETPEGELVGFTTRTELGAVPVVTTGRVVGRELVIETVVGGKMQVARLPWSADIRGFLGDEQSLAAKPMRPGERRKLRMLLPILNQISDVELAARDYESTKLLDGSRKLLRIDHTATLGTAEGNETRIESTLWTDEAGQKLKSRTEAMRQESYRTSREVAMAEPDSLKYDLVIDAVVTPDRPIKRPHATRRVLYSVQLEGADPRKSFSSGGTQSVKSTGPETAEIEVRAIRISDSLDRQAPGRPPGSEYLDSSDLVTSDDAAVIKMAAEATRGVEGKARVALALEQYVHRTITKKNFSQALATAADVAKSREGDCTEHAVLLAALGRAVKIPSQVAIGLVYVEGLGGFGYHMWTEMFIGGSWIPLDATLGQGGTGAAHLKLSDSSLKSSSAYSSFLPVAQVLGRLKIKVLEVEHF